MSIDPHLSVNELVLRHPAALPILTAAGIDTCCGGGLTLAAAAQGTGLTFEQLVGRLQRGCGCGHRGS
jgi:iron-sulfur cluster repair protein YtfE (RIC family)